MATTAPTHCEFNTGPDYCEVSLRKNDKVNGIICSGLLSREDTKYEGRGSLDDYFSYGIINIISGNKILPLTAGNEWLSFYDDIVEFYKLESIDSNLNIKDLFIKEYEPNASINILHSLINIGSEIFQDARPSNAEESKIVKGFVRSKSKLISSKKL